MRRLAPLCFGLALAAPALVLAQAPAARHGHLPQSLHAGHLCTACADKLPKRVPASGPGMPPPVVHHGGVVASTAPAGCASCQVSAAPAYEYGYAPTQGQAPGIAYVGGEAAGYAQVGGLASSEPAPIGVMRTDYAPAAAPGYGNAPIDPMHGDPALRGGAGRVPYGPAAPGYGMAPGMGHGDTSFGAATRSRQGKVLANMIGLPTFRPLGARGAERRRESHAMMSYGSGAGIPSELPASMVYGPR